MFWKNWKRFHHSRLFYNQSNNKELSTRENSFPFSREYRNIPYRCHPGLAIDWEVLFNLVPSSDKAKNNVFNSSEVKSTNLPFIILHRRYLYANGRVRKGYYLVLMNPIGLRGLSSYAFLVCSSASVWLISSICIRVSSLMSL